MDDLDELRQRTRSAVIVAIKARRRARYRRAVFYQGALLGWFVTGCVVIAERLL